MSNIIAKEDRAHALLSASGSKRWMLCPGSVKAEQKYFLENPDKIQGSSIYAQEGEFAHEVAEYCFRNKIKPKYENIKKQFGDKEWDLREVAYNVAKYYTIIGKRIKHINNNKTRKIFCEVKVDFSKWVKDGFGTMDFAVVANNECHIFDLKYGQNVLVEAEDNSQLQLYALGMLNLLELKEIKVNKFFLNIIQPRVDNYSLIELTKAELLDFGKIVKEKSEIALKDNAPFSPGDEQCRWCGYKGACQARADEFADSLGFKNLDEIEEDESPMNVKPPETMSDDNLSKVLGTKNLINSFLKECEEQAVSRMMTGKKLDGFKVIESTKKAEVNEKKFNEFINKHPEFKNKLYITTRVNLTEMKKIMGKVVYDKITFRPAGNPKVAPADSKKPQYTALEDTDFDLLEIGK